ncbi:MAG: response regulator [Deltaproteobacteria bacterium]|jgi:CheY-like chemotaxis protein|nr:response regulator [Deltaproteobacteria bacterium]
MNRKILVVDDEKSIRDLFESAFSDAGYEVHLAENGDRALDILGSQEIELIFLDLKLFGMNGIDLCRQIRTTKPIAIIYAITGWSGLFEIEECREAGFDDYFKKPVALDLLFKAVGDAFEKLDRWKRRYPGT